jgi:hypothetical protein
MKTALKDTILKIFDLPKIKKIGNKLGIITHRKKIIVKQLYCPKGDPLIKENNPKFDGHPGIHLICEGEKYRQSIYLSPFQGDDRKFFQKDYRSGEELFFFCPECEEKFPQITSHNCQFNAKYVALFLNQKADLNNVIYICNIWHCPNSQLILSGKILSEVKSK